MGAHSCWLLFPFDMFSSFFNWIYWGEIGSQSHISFKGTTHQNIIGTLHHAPIAQSKVSFYLHLSPLCPLQLTPTPLSVYHYIVVCVYVFHMCVCLLNPFTFLHPNPSNPFPADSCQSVSCIHAFVSILFITLFCSLESICKHM